MFTILVTFLTVIADQITKYFVCINMDLGETIPVIKNVVHLTYIINPGAAFGIFRDQQWLFFVTAVVFFGAFLVYYDRLRRSGTLIHYGSVALAAGAVSNLIDRIRLGHVVDFFDFRVWPVFNVADIAIVLGTSAVLWALFVQRREI